MKPSFLSPIQFTVAAGFALTLLACGAPTPKEVGDITAEGVSSMVTETVDALNDANNLNATKRFMSSVSSALSAPTGATYGSAGYALKPPQNDEALQAAVKDIQSFLRTKVFIDDNVESRDGGAITFKLKGANVCQVTTLTALTSSPYLSGAVSTSIPSSSAACAMAVNLYEIRLRAKWLSPTQLELALLLTSAKNNPLTLTLEKDKSVSLKVNLSQLSALGAGTGTNVLRGVVEFKATKNREHDYTYETFVREDVDFRLGTTVKFIESASSDPMSSIRLNGVDKTVTLGLHTKNASMHIESSFSTAVPGARAAQTPSSSIDYEAKNVGYTLTLDDNASNFASGSIALQSILFLQNGKQVVKTSLNENNGAAFAFQAAAQADESVLLTVKPLVDLKIEASLKNLASTYNASDLFYDETVNYALTASPSVDPVVRLTKGTADRAGQFQVVEGQLVIASTAAPNKTVRVEKGQCLLPVQNPADSMWLSRIQAGNCQ